MKPFSRTWLSAFPLAVVSLGLVLTALAQSPTETFIRIQHLRSSSDRPFPAPVRQPVFPTQSQLTSRGGFVRSRVTVTAPTLREASHQARRLAVRHAYTRVIHVIAVPNRQIQALSEELAATTAELKSTQATILSQKKTAHGYSVEAEYNQSNTQLVQDIRTSGLSNFRLVALLPERIDGEQVASPAVETALVGALAEQHFSVYDWNFVATQKPLNNLVLAALSDQTEAATQLGSRFLANILIIGRVDAAFSQDNDGIISYIASTNLRCIRVDTGQILLAQEFSEKGFGRDKAQAARQALAALAQSVATQLPQKLLNHFQESAITVQVALGQPEQTNEVQQFLQGLTGVIKVEETQTPTGVEFHVTSRDKPSALGLQIGQSPEYQVLGYGPEDR